VPPAGVWRIIGPEADEKRQDILWVQ